MRVFVVKRETDLTALTTKLVRAGASPDELKRTEARLRTANPHLDLNRLKSGAVLIVPEAPEIRAENTDSITGTVLGALAGHASDSLHALRVRLDDSAQNAEAERRTLAEVLSSRGVKEAAEADESLRRDLDRLRESLARETEDAAQQGKALDQALRQAEADIKNLQRRFR